LREKAGRNSSTQVPPLIEPIGFPVATGAFVAAHSWYLGRYRSWVTVLAGGMTGAIVYHVFMEFLELTFPLGLLEYFRSRR
jgi:hypothetical protein